MTSPVVSALFALAAFVVGLFLPRLLGRPVQLGRLLKVTPLVREGADSAIVRLEGRRGDVEITMDASDAAHFSDRLIFVAAAVAPRAEPEVPAPAKGAD